MRTFEAFILKSSALVPPGWVGVISQTVLDQARRGRATLFARWVERTLEAVAGHVPRAEMEAAIVAGRIDEAIALIRAAAVVAGEADAKELIAYMAKAHRAGSGAAAAALRTAGFGLDFELPAPEALAWAAQHAGELIVEATSDMRAAVEHVVSMSLAGSMTPPEAARKIQKFIPLNSRLVRAQLRFEARVDAAVAVGAMTVGRAAKAIALNRKRLVRYRARMISRTEIVRALNAGQEALWAESFRRGLLPNTVKRMWIVTPDDLLCPICLAMQGLLTSLGVPWMAGGRAVMTPQDIHPHCRCCEGLVFKAKLGLGA